MEKSISSDFKAFLPISSNFKFIKNESKVTESIGDNFDQEMSYLWTDERLVHLVTKFYDYVHSTDILVYAVTRDRPILLLHTLQMELLNLNLNDAPKDAPKCPCPNEITEKLNEIAYSYRRKDPNYYDLKEIFGKHVCKKFRVLTRHERFDEYLQPGSDSHRVSSIQAVKHSICPGSSHYYWTDRRLQVLVNAYYIYLQAYKSDSRGQGSSEKNSEKCLAYLKKSLDGNVSIPNLRCQLNKIFDDYKVKSPAHEEFRTRIGKEICALFDSLVKLDWSFYKNKDTTLSRSRGISSKRKSSGMIKQEIAKIEKQVEADRVYKELETYELNDEQIAVVMLKLSDNEDKRTSFWRCKRSVRKYYAIRLISEQ